MAIGGGGGGVAIGGAAAELVIADVAADAAAAALPVAAVEERLVRTVHTFGGQTHRDGFGQLCDTVRDGSLLLRMASAFYANRYVRRTMRLELFVYARL